MGTVVQTSYSTQMEKAFPGLRFCSECVTTTRIAEGDINFGYAVKRGTDKDRQAKIGGGADFIGIALRTISKEGAYADASINISDTQGVDVMREGICYASPANDVTAGDKVVVVTATGRLKGGSAAEGETQLSNAYWDSSADADGLALVVIGLGSVGTVAEA